MRTYSKDDVINAIGDFLRDVVEVESIEHVEGSEFSVRIIITTCASCLLSAFVNQCLERSLMKLKDLVRA